MFFDNAARQPEAEPRAIAFRALVSRTDLDPDGSFA
jgi:hypothetical protein